MIIYRAGCLKREKNTICHFDEDFLLVIIQQYYPEIKKFCGKYTKTKVVNPGVNFFFVVLLVGNSYLLLAKMHFCQKSKV